jgi:hypothetical protein
MSETAMRASMPAWRSRLPTSEAIASSPPCRWSAPDVSMTVPSGGSVETTGEYRNAHTAIRCSAIPSASGSACCTTRSDTSACALVAGIPARKHKPIAT